MNINVELKKYIESNILSEYEQNDEGHNIEHIQFVLNRAFEINKNYHLDDDILYTIVCYHDIACHINRDKHEKLSADRFYSDKKLRDFFNDNQMLEMKEAIEDHRASLEYEPRNIYGKILSSADRKVDVDVYLKASMGFYMKKQPNILEQELIEDSYNFAIKKFGKQGYAVNKIYVKDEKYENFLKEIQYLIDNKPIFIERAKRVLKGFN